jgi:hypothetical protein
LELCPAISCRAELSAAFSETHVDISHASSVAQLAALEAGELESPSSASARQIPATTRYTRSRKRWASCSLLFRTTAEVVSLDDVARQIAGEAEPGQRERALDGRHAGAREI